MVLYAGAQWAPLAQIDAQQQQHDPGSYARHYASNMQPVRDCTGNAVCANHKKGL